MRATARVSPRSSPSSIEEHAAKGTLQPGDDPYVPPPAPDTALRFPGKAVALPDGSFIVSDTANHQVVHLEADLETERARWGGRGSFNEPQGVLLATPAVRRRARHRPARRRLGEPPAQGNPLLRQQHPHPRRDRQTAARTHWRRPGPDPGLSTPWDLAWLGERLLIAMAGTHQLWAWTPGDTIEQSMIEVVGGTANEGLRDGDAHQAWFAQPSGLCTSADGRRVWIADSETSALRVDHSWRRRRAHRRDPRRHGPVRLRPPRRAGRAGAAPAPPRRHRAARRVGRDQRHLQRGDPPLRPCSQRRVDARSRPRRAK